MLDPLDIRRLTELRKLATTIGWGAAQILREAEDNFSIEVSGDSPVTSADLAANEHILTGLQSELGIVDFAYLTEETYATEPPENRLGKPWVWIIDPLDGTQDFIQRTGEYAVHIALIHHDRPVLSVVACPTQGKLYSAIKGQGTTVSTIDGPAVPVRVSNKTNAQEMVVLASRNHRNDKLELLLNHLAMPRQSVGSVGGKVAAIVEQRADLYLAVSGTSAPKDWDFAAPELILTEAGGRMTHFDGSPLRYNQPDISQWGGIVASNGASYDRICQEINLLLAQNTPQ